MKIEIEESISARIMYPIRFRLRPFVNPFNKEVFGWEIKFYVGI